jgi:hypothetical protein
VTALAVLPGLRLAPALIALTVAVFGSALVYEHLRTHATGYTDETPPRLRPSLVALWVAVGAGYAIRGVAGLALAVNLERHPGVAVAAISAMWAYGVAFVTSRWVIEALAFARSDQGKLVWRVRPDQAREHLLALVRWLPQGPHSQLPDGRPTAWQPLRSRTRLSAPWNLSALLAAVAGAAGGSILAGASAAACAGISLAAGALAVAVLRSSRRVLALFAAGAGLAAVLLLSGVPRPALPIVAWFALLAAQLVFLSQSLDTTGKRFRLLLGAFLSRFSTLASSRPRVRTGG